MTPIFTFTVVVGYVSFIFNVLGYDNKKVKDVMQDIDIIIDTMKKRGDFSYESTSDYAEMIVSEAWKHHIHLEYKYTYETFFINK